LSGELKDFVQQLLAIIAAQAEEIAVLRDEVAVLKGHKPRPVFKGSNLDKSTDAHRDDDDEPPGGGLRPGSQKRSKTATLAVHEVRVLRPAEPVPPGSTFKGYSDFMVQDLVIRAHNVQLRRERWLTPDGRILMGALPREFAGCHFGPQLRAFILYQHHQCHVTQPLLREQLQEWGVDLSAGQLDALLTQGADAFTLEKTAVLMAGLQASPVVTVDDTAARHQGCNGYATNVSGPAFAWFSSTGSKSRLSFLELLHAGAVTYAVNDTAIRYMVEHGLPVEHVATLARGPRGGGPELAKLQRFLELSGITSAEHRLIATEGALWGGLTGKVHPDLAVVSDGAGQFDVGSAHGLCWVHAERLIHKLIPACDEHRSDQTRVRGEVWALYAALKRYRDAPTPDEAQRLGAQFDQVFNQNTSFIALNEQLARLRAHKSELLLVLRRPDVPLHTNQSETDIRDYVKKRKVSGGTRSDLGRACRDAFATLKKTCRKLDVSFWRYLEDRTHGRGAIAPLGSLVLLRTAELCR
jgi:hypothetical protein